MSTVKLSIRARRSWPEPHLAAARGNDSVRIGYDAHRIVTRIQVVVGRAKPRSAGSLTPVGGKSRSTTIFSRPQTRRKIRTRFKRQHGQNRRCRSQDDRIATDPGRGFGVGAGLAGLGDSHSLQCREMDRRGTDAEYERITTYFRALIDSATTAELRAGSNGAQAFVLQSRRGHAPSSPGGRHRLEQG